MPEPRRPEQHSVEYVTLRDYFDRVIGEMDKRFEQRFEAATMALDKAERLLSEYKTASNEWRATLQEQRAEFVSRNEYAIAHRELSSAIEESKKTLERREGGIQERGRNTQSVQFTIGLVASIVLGIVALVVAIIHR